VANDFGYDEVFSRYIEALANKGDVLFAITTSGNSINILKAIKQAREKAVKVVLLTGNSGGAAAELADISIIVPHHGYADRIQEVHIKIIHIIILLIEKLMKEDAFAD
jgi:D-sedoheptulose 7-phosphate isomerase